MKNLIRKTAKRCFYCIPDRVRNGVLRLVPTLEKDWLATTGEVEQASREIRRELREEMDRVHREVRRELQSNDRSLHTVADMLLREVRRLHRRMDDLEEALTADSSEPALRRAA